MMSIGYHGITSLGIVIVRTCQVIWQLDSGTLRSSLLALRKTQYDLLPKLLLWKGKEEWVVRDKQ